MAERDYFKDFTKEQREWIYANTDKIRRGATESETYANIARALIDNGIVSSTEDAQKLVNMVQKPTLSYDLQSIAQTAGFHDRKEGDKTITAGDQLLDAFYKGKIDRPIRGAINLKYGEGGWSDAKKVMQGETLNRMHRDIAKNRAEILEGRDGVKDWMESAFMGLFQPRQKKAYMEGRDPDSRDIGMDIASNVLYGLPVGRAEQAVKLLASGAKPVLQKAAGVAGYVVPQALAPHAVEALDAKVYDRPYDEANAILGTLTNIGINRSLLPLLGGGMQYLSGSLAKQGSKARAIIEGIQGPRAQAKQTYKKAEQTIKDAFEFNPEKYNADILAGKTPKEPPTPEAINEAKEILIFRDKYAKQASVKENVQKLDTELGEAARESAALRRQAPQYMSDIRKNPYQIDEELLAGRVNRQKNNRALETVFDDVHQKMQGVASRHPELAADVLSRATKGRDFVASVRDYGPEITRTYLVNQLGNNEGDAVADRVLSVVGAKSDDVRKLMGVNPEEQAKQKKLSEAKAVIQGVQRDYEGLSEDDKKYLGYIAENPGVLQGYGRGSETGFRNWLLLRGQDLIRETPLFRATPEAR